MILHRMRGTFSVFSDEYDFHDAQIVENGGSLAEFRLKDICSINWNCVPS